MKKTLNSFMFVALALVLLSACSSGNNNDDSLAFKSADVVEKESPHTKGMEKFAEDVEENSDGQIKMKHYSDGQLGDEEDIIEGVKSGSIDFAATGILPGTEIPETLDSPFLYEDEESLNKIINSDLEDEILEEINKEGATENLKVIGIIPNMTRVITTKGKEIQKPEDMKNLKIRVPEADVYLDTFKALGANPAPLAFTELYTSLQTGVIDAQENPYQIIYDSSFYEVQDTVIETNHIIPPRYLIVNEDVYDSLSSEQEKLIMENWSEAELHMEELIAEDEEEYIEKLKEEGMTFIEPDIDEFEDATEDVQEKQAEILGEDLFEKIEEID